MDTIYLIIRSHQRSGPCILDGKHEWHQVDLAQGSLGYDSVYGHSLMFLIITDEVFWGCNDIFFLNSIAVFRAD